MLQHYLYYSDVFSTLLFIFLLTSTRRFSYNSPIFHVCKWSYSKDLILRQGPLLARGKSRHFATPPTVSPRNDVWKTNAEISYRLRITTQIWVVLLIGRATREICFNQPNIIKCDHLLISFFFQLSWLCIDIYLGNEPYSSKIVFGVWLFEKACDASSVWNFCARFSGVISRGNQWWCREMSSVFSG